MIRYIIIVLLTSSFLVSRAQTSYIDSMNVYLQNYVQGHDVVQGDDKKNMQFYAPSQTYRVAARFEKAENGAWFEMPTSGKMKKIYRVYGSIHFHLHDTLLRLNVYQSQSLMTTEKYRDHLFLPFTDATSGTETYASGRYIDLSLSDIKNGTLLVDFNKAYNPYCAYVSGRYNCPIPPKENALAVFIKAGEKNYAGH